MSDETKNEALAATPTAALVEEAETHTTCDKCGAAIVKYSDFTGLLPTEDGMRSHTTLVCERTQELRRAEAERDHLRATVTRLDRRAQTAEAGVRDNVEACKAAGVSMGRMLANAAADMYLRRAEKAEAERDAQHAEVLRLTGERDEARVRHRLRCAMMDELHKLCDRREAEIADLTATRDLLTAENERLRKERDERHIIARAWADRVKLAKEDPDAWLRQDEAAELAAFLREGGK